MKKQGRSTECPSTKLAFWHENAGLAAIIGVRTQGMDTPAPEELTLRGRRGPFSGRASKNNFKIYVRSRNIYENKGSQDIMSEKKRAFRSEFSTFCTN